ncbi:hypothetical protein AWH69_07885 [Janibacter melonis]|uniref:Uncharacterized protein n=1 Tax=Janibacter melonis TaxID=262209 RepID=A0A176QE65_9MICO|nr:hypothetical protein AWH69_07885 [Janibacter melonis]
MSPIITARPVVIISPDGDPFAQVDISLGASYPPADLHSLLKTDRSMQAQYLGKHSPDPSTPVWRIPSSAREYAAKAIEALGYPVERRTDLPEPLARSHTAGWECPVCTYSRKRKPNGQWGRCPQKDCGTDEPAIPAGTATSPVEPTDPGQTVGEG